MSIFNTLKTLTLYALVKSQENHSHLEVEESLILFSLNRLKKSGSSDGFEIESIIQPISFTIVKSIGILQF